ncbi:LysM repeat protein [Paenibacillus phyllosphaerae]|uniref:LysM repeat protein n=1 Tax=Paenibacillus phyllosphaerae TaxID=274593 RepID=A0A7W5FMG4_9BACL|nr:LysM peptidoglycan-binding domain-containing protein [Paenibacillus phyllosphaerae]MBB3110246.1 LysM repeat protein [Paenibacillus phyllosphaerae]
MKKTAAAWLFTASLLCMPAPSASAASPTVSLRNVFRTIDAQVGWNPSTNQITVTREGVSLLFTPGSRIAYKNGVAITMDTPITIDKKTNLSMISVYAIYPLAKNNADEHHYIVQSGDTLSAIAKKYGVSVANLKEWSGLTTDRILPGEHIYTMNPNYIVESGDTLYSIAAKYETTVAAIKSANNLTSDLIALGQLLYIPTEQTVTPPSTYADGHFPLLNDTYGPFGNTYGDTRSYTLGETERVHEGNDIEANQWTPIFSVYDGRIVRKGWSTLGGWRLSIETPDKKTVFYYAHLAAYAKGITNGMQIKQGQLIGYVGSTGYGPAGTSGKFINHLHFGMYDSTTATWKALNPYTRLKWWEKQ